jgi:hypothetical protein
VMVEIDQDVIMNPLQLTPKLDSMSVHQAPHPIKATFNNNS